MKQDRPRRMSFHIPLLIPPHTIASRSSSATATTSTPASSDVQLLSNTVETASVVSAGALSKHYDHDEVDLARIRHTQSVDEIINFVFPPEILNNPEACMERAIFSPYNEFVDEFNSQIQARMAGNERTYFSADSIVDDVVPGDDSLQIFATQDFLNALTEPGIPPHELTLKVGSICHFTRDFSAAKGITKNARVIVRRLLRYSVEVSTLPMQIEYRYLPSVSTSTDATRVISQRHTRSLYMCHGLTASLVLHE
jgi:hypothetical protein